MVEFCGACGESLPKGDLTFRKGKHFTSPDYVCPSCRKPANPKGNGGNEEVPEPSLDNDIVIRKGQTTTEGD